MNSDFLLSKKPLIKKMVSELSKCFEYVSVLGTDVAGKTYRVQTTGVSFGDSMWTERGFVLRVYNGKNYFEYSFNEISDDGVATLIEKVKTVALASMVEIGGSGIQPGEYPLIEEQELKESFSGDVAVLPGDTSPKEIIEKLTVVKDEGHALSDLIVNMMALYEWVNISKIFISNKKDLMQSYIWSQGYLYGVARRDGKTKYALKGFSGLKGPEMLDEMHSAVKGVIDKAIMLLDAVTIEPGEYDVICSPDVSGLIAHEAFGHGVEMDMFVKNRAKAVEYIERPVASAVVEMHDGAAAAREVSSYLFDDEGTIGTDTVIIDAGILKTGISDLLSALKLGTKPTGNGKRESFERKAYARMTNTFFSPGKDKLEDMIASIDYGYLLEDYYSGMEDPKNWGIQCVVAYGREIKDGKLTGKIVSPVMMTGYVPDLLKSITMVSGEIKLSGTGACGKGHKEWSKVSSGGPYLKAKARLG